MRIHATLLLSGLSFSCEGGGREGGREEVVWINTVHVHVQYMYSN